MDHEAHSHMKFVNMKSQRVKLEDAFAPVLEDETETIEHLLAEPKSEYVTIDGVLCFGKENAGKCLNKNEEFSSGYAIGLNTHSGGLHSAYPRGRDDELEFGVLDGLLDEVDEVEDIHAADGLANPCDDYLLDIGFPGKLSELDFGPYEGSYLANSSSESLSPGLSGSSNSAVGISESSTVTIQESECKDNSIEKAVTLKLQRGVRRKKRRQVSLGNVYPTSINFQNLNELGDDEKLVVGRIVSGENEKIAVEATKIDAFLKEKRHRKATLRYIEEFSGKKSKDSKGRERFSAVTATKDEFSKIKSWNEHPNTRFRTLTSVPEENTISENQTLAEFWAQRRRARKHASISVAHEVPWSLDHPLKRTRIIHSHLRDAVYFSRRALESDEEPITSESDYERVVRKKSKMPDRRKQQRMWTPAEMAALVDGISEYGVGRWTEIKNSLFASSDYRTPMDIRDKWRNLLRTSCGSRMKKEVEQKEVRTIPKCLIPRIRELAAVHPYPRQQGKKFAPPILPSPGKRVSSDLKRKYVRRKSFS